MINHLTTYLKEYPVDEKMITLFKQYLLERKTLVKEYEKHYEELTMQCMQNTEITSEKKYIYPKKIYFIWIEGSAPFN